MFDNRDPVQAMQPIGTRLVVLVPLASSRHVSLTPRPGLKPSTTGWGLNSMC